MNLAVLDLETNGFQGTSVLSMCSSSREFGNLREMELGNLYAWIMDAGTEGGHS